MFCLLALFVGWGSCWIKCTELVALLIPLCISSSVASPQSPCGGDMPSSRPLLEVVHAYCSKLCRAKGRGRKAVFRSIHCATLR